MKNNLVENESQQITVLRQLSPHQLQVLRKIEKFEPKGHGVECGILKIRNFNLILSLAALIVGMELFGQRIRSLKIVTH